MRWGWLGLAGRVALVIINIALSRALPVADGRSEENPARAGDESARGMRGQRARDTDNFRCSFF